MDKENVGYTYNEFPISYKTHNEILPLAIKWSQQKDILLIEISKTQEVTYFMFSLICGN